MQQNRYINRLCAQVASYATGSEQIKRPFLSGQLEHVFVQRNFFPLTFPKGGSPGLLCSVGSIAGKFNSHGLCLILCQYYMFSKYRENTLPFCFVHELTSNWMQIIAYSLLFSGLLKPTHADDYAIEAALLSPIQLNNIAVQCPRISRFGACFLVFNRILCNSSLAGFFIIAQPIL